LTKTRKKKLKQTDEEYVCPIQGRHAPGTFACDFSVVFASSGSLVCKRQHQQALMLFQVLYVFSTASLFPLPCCGFAFQEHNVIRNDAGKKN
jgi:hypothetical protein